MELNTKEIVYVATIDERQTNWNSNIMEKEGFIQTVEKLTKEIKVVEFCTDAHVQIGALLNQHLESFQNHILMYASKRQAFTPRVYDSRVVLAALDYNFHRKRPTQDG
ncbi:hypothetical protein F2P81_003918 [Scophthalmus maximus]|uniref:Uncharacterized protein n=1 Tax=Scophthalmus maximus TaxID=52904 RepID=A0A6A4TMA2_SCOMX|nr:hypothetical protein F2P81_003918 [Scophthalmus maximus]